ncbi:MAG: aldolase/citrate lyase family protein [Desulfobacterales bacterium]|nr:aldolase/citrate lyase family protein [Desulfobacterales bacterium]
MAEPDNRVAEIRRKMRNRGVTLGSWMQLDNPSVAEIMGSAGYDWVAVDLEHGHFSTSRLPDIFRALELKGTLPFARIAQGRTKDIKQALDAGARGLIIPMTESAAMIEKCISQAFYPPSGTRGVGYSRANLFGKHFDAYAESHAGQILMVAQIESIKGVDNLEEILAVKGLDAVIVGPYDLSGSMGITADFNHPSFKKVLEKIRSLCKAAAIPCGYHVVRPDPKQLEEKIDSGYQFLAYGIDAVFLIHQAQVPEI